MDPSSKFMITTLVLLLLLEITTLLSEISREDDDDEEWGVLNLILFCVRCDFCYHSLDDDYGALQH